MTRRISTQFAAGMAVLALTAFGCTTTSGDDADTDAVSEFTQADQDEVLADETTGSDMASLETIYFEFDRSTVGSDARPLLRGNGDKMRRTGGAVRLEGYCDERGDEEYNLALGERRANSVKQYLENLGVEVEVPLLSGGTGAAVGDVDRDLAEIFDRLPVGRVTGFGHRGTDLREVDPRRGLLDRLEPL